MHRRYVCERSKIFGLISFHAARHVHAREILLHGHLDVRIGFIIAEHDIVFWMMLLNEGVFEDECLHLRFRLDNFHIYGAAHHSRYLRRPICILTNIGTHTIPQIDGFAYIDDSIVFIMPQIHTGCRWQMAHLF